MVDREVCDRRLARLEGGLMELRRLGRMERGDLVADGRALAAAERWLQLWAECALDLAHHLIAERGWQTPASYREAFRIRAGEGVLEPALARAMEGWAGLRNVLVNLYLEVDPERLFEILQRDLDGLEAYARQLTRAADRG
jgi:uncharacterized protein YutE (UPF0331/DUF86 family)